MKEKIFRSPLFYVGDKHKLIKEIKGYFPNNIETFIEPFGGGGSVFMNIEAKKYALNDIDNYVFRLHSYLMEQSKNSDFFFEQVKEKILKYGLSHSYFEDIVPIELRITWKKTYYAKFNQVYFNQLKKDFNNSNKSDMLHFYLLLIYGFSRKKS